MDFNCRFTDRSLTIKPHGSGLKLTINVPSLDAEGEDRVTRTSVWLDATDIRTVTEVLVGLGFGPQRTVYHERSIDGQLVALRSAADALHTIADTLAGNL